MVWIIKCWIPIETEKDQTYATKEELDSTIESLRLMQPENRYIVVGNHVTCYIPVDPEDPAKYPTKEDAQKDIDEHYEILQPYNIHEAIEIEE